MAGSMTDVWEKKLLDHFFRDAALGFDATNMYIALFTANPSDSSTGTEVTGGSYARVAVNRTSGSTAWDAATGTTALTDNTSAITFPAASANWGTVTGFGICKSLAGALSTDLIFWGTLDDDKLVESGDTFSFGAGNLDITLD